MIPISKYILNRKQNRATHQSCTIFAFIGFFYVLFYLLFATYLRQDKKVDNVGQNPTNLN